MGNKKALILGILGQDGSYLAELLYSKRYEICGVIKNDTDLNRIAWIINLIPEISIYKINLLDKDELKHLIECYRPTEIYNFCGVSNVFTPFENIDLIFDTNTKIPQYILETIRDIDPSIKYFQASSSLIFGHNTLGIQNEETPYNPIYPYGISKLAAQNLVSEFRKTFNLFASSGIFYTHESERRGENFFSKKITKAVANIKMGLQQTVKVGNLNAYRDYGYAPDYVEAAYLMMQNKTATDYVIGTGQLTNMMDFAQRCFEYVGLHYTNHIDVDGKLYRENDTTILRADSSKIRNELGWRPRHDVHDIVKIMVEYELNKIKNK